MDDESSHSDVEYNVETTYVPIEHATARVFPFSTVNRKEKSVGNHDNTQSDDDQPVPTRSRRVEFEPNTRDVTQASRVFEKNHHVAHASRIRVAHEAGVRRPVSARTVSLNNSALIQGLMAKGVGRRWRSRSEGNEAKKSSVKSHRSGISTSNMRQGHVIHQHVQTSPQHYKQGLGRTRDQSPGRTRGQQDGAPVNPPQIIYIASPVPCPCLHLHDGYYGNAFDGWPLLSQSTPNFVTGSTDRQQTPTAPHPANQYMKNWPYPEVWHPALHMYRPPYTLETYNAPGRANSGYGQEVKQAHEREFSHQAPKLPLLEDHRGGTCEVDESLSSSSKKGSRSQDHQPHRVIIKRPVGEPNTPCKQCDIRGEDARQPRVHQYFRQGGQHGFIRSTDVGHNELIQATQTLKLHQPLDAHGMVAQELEVRSRRIRSQTTDDERRGGRGSGVESNGVGVGRARHTGSKQRSDEMDPREEQEQIGTFLKAAFFIQNTAKREEGLRQGGKH